MGQEWRTAVAGVETAIRRIPDGALLHVYTFADDVSPVGTWSIKAGEMDRIVSEVRAAMGTDAKGHWTFIHSMADTLAARLRAAPAAKHVVFFVSDDDEDAPGYPDSSRARVRRDWAALDRRIPSSVRVVSVRLGNSSTFRSMVPKAAATPVSAISNLGATIAREIENDPFARQRKRERREPLLSASLVSNPQQVPYPGGDVKVAIASAAECGAYHLADGTEIGPRQSVVIERRVASPLGIMAGLFGSDSRAAAVSTVLPADLLRPRVARYDPVWKASSQDTVYAGAGHELTPVTGEIVFSPAPLWLRLLAILVAALVVLFTIFLVAWPLIPPLGGKLQTTWKLNREEVQVDLAPARAGKEIRVPAPPLSPGITIRLARVSRWGSPWHKVLVFRVVGEGSVGVAKEDPDTGGYQMTWLPAEESTEVREAAFILWPQAPDAERPRRLSAGKPETYPGYEWKP
jgi:hypothetical protein